MTTITETPFPKQLEAIRWRILDRIREIAPHPRRRAKELRQPLNDQMRELDELTDSLTPDLPADEKLCASLSKLVQALSVQYPETKKWQETT
jgi:hypothetical protein